MERVVFVGPGRLGLGLGSALLEADPQVALLYHGRRPEPPDHPLFETGRAEYRYGLERPPEGTRAVFLTVPDSVLPELAIALAGRGEPPSGCAAFHCSGVLGADPLAPLHALGYAVGTLHPLQSVTAGLSGAGSFRGTYFALSGEPEATSTGQRLVGILGGRTIKVPTSRRPLYHAAAVLASNYVVVLLHEAIRLFERAGASPEASVEALATLAEGTIRNVRELGVDGALTGPLIRGDVGTLELHLRSLDPEDAALYVALGRRALGWVAGRLPPETVERMEELFERYS